MGVAFSSCTVPAAGKLLLELGIDEMEFGVGIHGEPGRRRDKIKPAQDITNELLEAIIEDLKPILIKKCFYLLMEWEGHH